MRGQSEFDPEALGRQLSGFLPGRKLPASVRDYYAFYDLDLAADFAGLVHSMGYLDSGVHRLAVQLFSLPNPVGSVVVCHGYYDHVGLYGHLLRYLLGAGFSVVTFDQPGHGLSSGARATIGSFDEYVDALVTVLEAVDPHLPRPRHIVGQSMGGSVVMEYLLREDAGAFAEVVLLAPLVRPSGWPLNRLFYEVARRVITERKRTITVNAGNPEFIELMRRDPLAPQTLPVQWVTAMVQWLERFEQQPQLPFEPKIVQGLADQTVAWRYNLKLLERKCAPEILRVPGARHHLVNESPQIRAAVFEWIGGHLLRH